MPRLVPVLLAVLLALPAPGIAAVGAAPSAFSAPDSVTADAAAQADPPENTSTLLQLDEVQASNFTSPEANLGTALSMQGSEMDGQFEAQVVKRKLAGLNGEAKVRYALKETARLQAEVNGMIAAEERARQAYIEGEISVNAYLRTLGRLDARVADIRKPLRPIQNFLLGGGKPDLKREMGLLQSDLVILEGAVRNQVAGAVKSDSSSPSIYVAASSKGVVLSTVTNDGTYVREAYRSDYVDKSGPSVTYSQANSTLFSLYPWALSHSNGPAISRFGSSAWPVEISHTHGRLMTYFYGNASSAYRETQRKSLSNYPFNASEQTFSEDLVLTVNRTYAGGPLEVELTNQTGAPLDGEVRVNGTEIGTTGDDGLVWALQPEGSFTVVAVHDGERIELELEPTTARFGA